MKQTMNETKPSGWQRRTILFLTSQCITLFGSTLVQMAVVWYATMETASGAWVAAFTVCSYLPQFLISFSGGVWAEPVQQKTADRRSRCPYGAGYSGHAACSPAHHLQTAFSWRASFNVCHPFPWSRHTDPCCQCSHSSAGTRGAPDALQRNQCSHAVCGTVCRSCCRRSHLCSQHPGYNPDDRYCDCHFGNRPFILPVHSLL